MIPLLMGYLFIVLFSGKIPAPKITVSYSLNEKLFFFENFESEYLTIGSSIALNNISSDEILSGFNTKSYINFATWGVKPTDVFTILKAYISEYKPKVIIYASNEIDFGFSDKGIKESDIRQRIKNPNNLITPFYYFTNLDLEYYYIYYKDGRVYKTCDTINKTVKFDKYGGILLGPDQRLNTEIKPFWDLKIDMNKIEYVNYQYLDSISSLLANNNIKLVFVQTPVREGIIDDIYRKDIKTHVNKIREILDKYNHQLINSTTEIWPDTMFFDYGHFLSESARYFTTYCVEKIKTHNQYTNSNTETIQPADSNLIEY